MSAALQRLWAPWRKVFLVQPKRRGCFLCEAVSKRKDRTLHVVHRGKRVFCILNRYPYNVGHLMISPMRHTGDLTRLSADESAELMATASRMVDLLKRVLKSEGFNLGMNLGRAGGAGVPGHLHLHVVPRWGGDTNFMPVVGETKVMSLSLDALYGELVRAWNGGKGS